jgi:hypothetical protein
MPVHAGESEVRAVEGAQAEVVERVVVETREALGAVLVLPDPLAEPVFELLLLFAGG